MATTNLFDNYTFRCSSLWKIMQDPQGESNHEKLQKINDELKKVVYDCSMIDDPNSKAFEKLADKASKLQTKKEELSLFKDDIHLSETTKSYLAEVYTEVTSGRKKIIKNKFIEKGLELEEDAITQYCLKHGVFLTKNKTRKNNGFIEGEIDIEEEEQIVDTKVSWDIFTFDRTVLKMAKQYKWQAKGYCILWNKPKAIISYNLLDTPEKLIVNEEKSLMYSFIGTPEEYAEACKQIRFNCTYGDLPPERKERSYIVELEDGDEEKINARVEMCRKFLNNYESENRR